MEEQNIEVGTASNQSTSGTTTPPRFRGLSPFLHPLTMMCKMNKTKIAFGTLMLICILIAVYTVVNHNSNRAEWEEYEHTGYIKEFILYNQFPDQELYIGFVDGNWTLVNVNYFWTYTQLINLNTTMPVTITYKQNKVYHVKVTDIDGYYNEVEE